MTIANLKSELVNKDKDIYALQDSLLKSQNEVTSFEKKLSSCNDLVFNLQNEIQVC